MIVNSLFVEITNLSAVRYSSTNNAIAALKLNHGELPEGITPLLRQEVIPVDKLAVFTRIKNGLEAELCKIATKHSLLGWMVDPEYLDRTKELITSAQAEYEAEKEAFVNDYPVICESVIAEFHDKCLGHPACDAIISAVRDMQPSISYVKNGLSFSLIQVSYELLGNQAAEVANSLVGRAISDISRWSSEGLRAKSPATAYDKAIAIQSKLESFGYYSSAFRNLATSYRPIFDQINTVQSSSYSENKLKPSDYEELRKISAYLKSFASAKELHDYVDGVVEGIEYISPEIRQASLMEMASASQAVTQAKPVTPKAEPVAPVAQPQPEELSFFF